MNTRRMWVKLASAVWICACMIGISAVQADAQRPRRGQTANAEAPAESANSSRVANQASASNTPGALRYTIMVSKFESSSQWAQASAEWSITNAWSELLTDKLVQSGHFNVIAEKDMRIEGRQEQEFNESGWAQEGAKARGTRKVETGHMTGAQLLVKGTITHIAYDKSGQGGRGLLGSIGVDIGRSKAEVNLTVQVIDAQTGMVVASKSVVGKANKFGLRLRNLPVFSDVGIQDNGNFASACDHALAESVEFIVSQLDRVSWTGTVVTAAADKIVVNRGSREGVSIGQRFVVGDAKQIIDPDTGEVLDHVLTEVGELEVVKVSEKVAYCVVIDGSAPAKGMMIRLRT